MFGTVKRSQKHRSANAFSEIFRKKGWILATAWILITPFTRAANPAPPPVLGDGESLTYSVRWGFIPAVGKIVISADRIGTGRYAVLRVTTTTATWGLARGIFPFDGRGESIYDLRTGRLTSSSEWSSYRNKQVKNSTTFDYDAKMAQYTDDIHPEKSRSIPMPPGNPCDLIIALIQTRSWNLQPGEKRDQLVVFEDQFFPLTIHAEDSEYLWTTRGIYNTIPLVPRMEETPPAGMFKKGSTVKVWIEIDDNRHLPVRFEVGFRFGTGVATLTDYTPPN